MQKGNPVKMYYVSRENGIRDTVIPFYDDFKVDRKMARYQDEKEAHFVMIGDEIWDCVRITGLKLFIVDPW